MALSHDDMFFSFAVVVAAIVGLFKKKFICNNWFTAKIIKMFIIRHLHHMEAMAIVNYHSQLVRNSNFCSLNNPIIGAVMARFESNLFERQLGE